MKDIRKSSMAGSLTVEMSFLMPVILLLIMGTILAVFYYHDKNILSGAAYETAVVGSTKAREKDEIETGELETLFRQRVYGKCILFAWSNASIEIGEKEIKVAVTAIYKYMTVSIVQRAAMTEPEKDIRELRKRESVVDNFVK